MTIPWLEEMKGEHREAKRGGYHRTVNHDRLLALIAIAEAAQEYSAPEFRRLVEAVQAAERVE